VISRRTKSQLDSPRAHSSRFAAVVVIPANPGPARRTRLWQAGRGPGQAPESREKDWIPPYQVRGRLSQARNDIDTPLLTAEQFNLRSFTNNQQQITLPSNSVSDDPRDGRKWLRLNQTKYGKKTCIFPNPIFPPKPCFPLPRWEGLGEGEKGS
jgi:hypothetical protein